MTLWVTAVSFPASPPRRPPPSLHPYHCDTLQLWSKVSFTAFSEMSKHHWAFSLRHISPSSNGKFKYHISAECNIHLARDNTLPDVSHVSASEWARLSLWHQIWPWDWEYKFCLKLVCCLFARCFIGACVGPLVFPRVFEGEQIPRHLRLSCCSPDVFYTGTIPFHFGWHSNQSVMSFSGWSTQKVVFPDSQ